MKDHYEHLQKVNSGMEKNSDTYIYFEQMHSIIFAKFILFLQKRKRKVSYFLPSVKFACCEFLTIKY